MSFETLNLHPSILKAIADSGYTEPTPIQAQAIPELLAGRDLMACSQTGSGKTAAFVLPALHRLATPSAVNNSKGPRVLILTPTRELAQQVCTAATQYGKHMRFKIISILGGMPYPVQNRLLSGYVDILVATPGRLIDHLERGRIDFSRLEMLILDEADRMLDMGFVDDVERIAGYTPQGRQTLLFSATLDGVVGNLADRLMHEPKRITVSAAKTKHENIEQRMMFADDVAHKNKLLSHILTGVDLNQAIVFTATKRDADSLADQLSAQGHSVAALHGDMSQRERNRTLLNLRNGNVRVLVATDVAARGIDVRGISHVINFDLPKFAEDYVHRIGRTGRGGASGVAISFASNRDAQLLKRIERYTDQRLQMHTIEGLEPKFKLRTEGGPRGDRRGQGGPRGEKSGYAPRGDFGNRAPFGAQRNDNFGNREGFAPRADNFGNREQPQGQRPEGNRGGFGGQRRDFGGPRERDFGGQRDFGNRGSTFHGNGNNGGAGFHHSAPDSRHAPRTEQRHFGNRPERSSQDAGNRSGDRAPRSFGGGNRNGGGNRGFGNR